VHLAFADALLLLLRHLNDFVHFEDVGAGKHLLGRSVGVSLLERDARRNPRPLGRGKASYVKKITPYREASPHLAAGFFNFGDARFRAHLIYGIAAPVVGWMLWRMRHRARFAFYIFVSCELIRFWRHGLVHWEVPLLYGGLIGWLYTPAARAALPIIRATDRLTVYARLWPLRKRPPEER